MSLERNKDEEKRKYISMLTHAYVHIFIEIANYMWLSQDVSKPK